MKRKIVFMIVFFITLLWIPNALALPSQMTYENGHYFYYENGDKYKGFKEIDGKTYFFSRWTGELRTGMFQIDGTYYYFHETEGMKTGLQTIDGKTYLFDNTGKRLSSFQILDGKTYFFSRWSGELRTGMFQIDGIYYYFTNDGMQTGFHTIGGDNYYFDTDGKRLSGFQYINGKTLFFSRVDGKKRAGFFQVDGVYYYFHETEGMQFGLHEIGGNKYYFNEDGSMHKGFKEINGKTYFFSRVNGQMRTGTFQIDGIVYSFDSNGALIIEKTTEQKNQDIISEIKETYGFGISYGEGTYGYYGEPCPILYDHEQANKALESIYGVLQNYPDGFFRQFQGVNGFRVILFADIPGDASGVTMYEIGNDNQMYLDASSPLLLERTFHHETWHFMERYMLIKNNWVEPFGDNWHSLNPDGFVYETTDSLQYTFYDSDKNNAFYDKMNMDFISAYAKSSGKEDRAELFADLMFRSYKREYMNAGYGINEKAQILAIEIRKYWSNSIGATWERYITWENI